MFAIEDDWHAELMMTELDSFDEAMQQLRDWATIPWDQVPNRAPCTGWPQLQP